MGESGLTNGRENIQGWIQPVVVLWTTWFGRHHCWIASYILPSYLNSQMPIIDLLHVFLSCFVRPDERKIDQGNNWVSYDKYKWSPSNWNCIREVLCDHQSSSYRSRMINALVCHADTNKVARTFDNYIHQAFERACVKVKASVGRKFKGPKWYDQELRFKKSQAIKAGETRALAKAIYWHIAVNIAL